MPVPYDSKKVKSIKPNGQQIQAGSLKTRVQEGFIAMLGHAVKHNGKTYRFLDAFNENFLYEALDPKSQAFKIIAERLYAPSILVDIDEQVKKSIREDEDFLSYRIYKQAFELQQRVLFSKARDIGIMAGRRSGKSSVGMMLAASDFIRRGGRTLIIGLTISKASQIFSDGIIKILKDLSVQFNYNRTDERIESNDGSVIQFGGNSNKVEREKYRGQFWSTIIVDEAQSQQGLRSLVSEILNPMLIDLAGRLVMIGTGPRIPNTYWEEFYNNPSSTGLRLNWSLSQNPFIKDHKTALDDVKQKYSLTENDPLFLREYLGLAVYDTDAVAFRVDQENYYTDDELKAFIDSQYSGDLHLIGGLDYGFVDADAFCIILYSDRSDLKFIVYESKASGRDVSELRDSILAGKEYTKTSSLFSKLPGKDFDIFADNSDQKISKELSAHYQISIFNAAKHDANLRVQVLSDEFKNKTIKIRPGGPMDDEAAHALYKRIDQDGLPSVVVRELDDEVYHVDMAKAVIYALGSYWLTRPDRPLGGNDA